MLDLRYSGVTNAGVQAFRAAVPECKITYVDSAPRVPISKIAAPPAGAGEQAIAQWLKRSAARSIWRTAEFNRFRWPGCHSTMPS